MAITPQIYPMYVDNLAREWTQHNIIDGITNICINVEFLFHLYKILVTSEAENEDKHASIQPSQ
jgi:hypothetical protein